MSERRCQGCGANLAMAVRCAYCGTVAGPGRVLERGPAWGEEQRLLREIVRDLDGPMLVRCIESLAGSNPKIALMLAELVIKVQEEAPS